MEDIKRFSDTTFIQLLNIIGNKWNAQVLISLYKNECIRFTHLYKKVDGISQKMLSISLKTLEDNGLVSRMSFPEIPPRVEYRLTSKGADLVNFLNQLSVWNDKLLLE
jgi:DNA-binding HxlR family transcriptional regulator